MHTQNFYRIVIKAIGVALLLSAFAAQSATENPHSVSKDSPSTSCSTCHTVNPTVKSGDILETKNNLVDQDNFSQDGTTMCSSCHNPDDNHKVGLELDFQIPADLPLDKKNAMTCLTCHYTHGSLTSERPQASFSLMDRLFDADRLHKSFLLRRNNSDGELCLTCHNVNKGSK